MKKSHLLCSLLLAAISANAETIDLSGAWDIRFNSKSGLENHKVSLPGSMLTNGLGNKVDADTKWTGSLYDMSYYHSPRFEKYRREGNIKFPFFLTPDHEFVGSATYSKKIKVPESWNGTEITLCLERPHIETEIYVNSAFVGKDSTLSAPHRFNVTPYIKPGKENVVEVKVYNGIENVCVGQDSHSVTDQTQGNWNGITGKIKLQSRPSTNIANVKIYPRVNDKAIDVALRLNNPKKLTDVTLIVDGKKKTFKKLHADKGIITLSFPMGDDVRLWDEFNPNLYTLTAIVGRDSVTESFGMREIAIRDRQFYLNGRPIWLRGTVENCNFPLTGYPPTDVESWLRVLGKCKEYGLNHVRFHSYCPPEAAFVAADRLGIYLQPEGPSWPNHGVKLGNGMTIDRYLMEETQRMVEEYGNHPSFTMLAAGNEPAGNWVEWVGDFVDAWRASGDDRRVYCGASVGGGWAWDPKSQYHVKGGARGLDWNKRLPGSADDFAQDMETVTQKGREKTLVFDLKEPRVAHEAGQWCAFPDFREIDQYSGPYKARNFEIFKETLAENGMAGMAGKFLQASGNLQTLAYKYEIERNLRTPNYSGFQLLGLNDYSGQGTALVGVLNVFWKEKGYADSKQWGKFCSPTVPLARFPKFVFTSDEQLTIPVELYNAGDSPLHDAKVSFSLTDPSGAQKTLKQSTNSFGIGKNIPLDTIRMSLKDFPTGKYTLTASVGPDASNEWDFWVYPANLEMPETNDIFICDSLSAEAERVLENGGKVLITAAGKVRYGNDVVQNFLPVFWNTSWFKMRPPHTTGASIDTSHPVFREFPTDNWSNLNWWELLNRAQVMNLSEFPKDYQPPVQPIDTWHVNRKLGMIVEGRMHNGRVLMTTFDIDSNLDRRPVARQMRKAILDYMSGDDFNPSLTLAPAIITNLFENEAEPIKMYTNDSPDELKPVIH